MSDLILGAGRQPRPHLQPRAVLELLKPITWFAPMWAYGCGVISAGVPLAAHPVAVAAGIALAGPLVCASSQAANDWYDRHVDALNEPNRPIPSGRLPGRSGLWIALAWGALSLIVAALLGPWAAAAACLGLALGWAYSAPPFRLKRDGWWSNAVCGACYEGLPWLTGIAVMTGGPPNGRALAIAALYSAGAHGIMTLNDFKSIDGDRRMALRSLPARYGADRAARLACLIMAAPQVVVIALLALWSRPMHATAVAVLLGLQLILMGRLLGDPRGRAPWYNGTGTTLYVIGMMVTAFALRSLLP